MFGRRKVAALVAEFLGAGVWTIVFLSVQHSGIGYPLFIAASVGVAVMLVSYVLGDASGGHFNPAITLGQWIAGKTSTITGILYIAVQLLGGWLAYYLYIYLVNNHLAPIGGHFSGRILVAEAVGTGLLAFAFTATVYKGLSRAVSASYFGLAVIVSSIIASSGAIGLLNPAVALGARAWVWGTYVLGPVIGGIVGTLLYKLFFVDGAEGGLLGNFSMASFTSSSSSSVIVKPKPAVKKSSAKKRK